MTKVSTVRRGDIDRVLRALGSAGQSISKIELRPGGEVVIFPGLAPSPEDSQMNDLDAWRARRAERKAQGS